MTADPETATMLLAGHDALVTRGCRGAGRAVAVELARAGAGIAVLDDHPADCEALASEIQRFGTTCLVAHGDVLDPLSVGQVLHKAREAGLNIDTVVNGSGALVARKFWQYDELLYRDAIDSSLSAAYIVSHTAARDWVARGIRGRIINVTSAEADVATSDCAPFVAAQGGVLTLTKALAVALGQYGIRVNAIGCPLVQETGKVRVEDGILRLSMESGAVDPLMAIGQAAVFLASDMSALVTGTILYVDGGRVLA